MSRVQLALNVDDLDASIAFYTKLFQTPPAKVREDYANFAIADPPLKLVLFADAGEPGTLNHIGVEVESTDEVAAAIARANDDGFDQNVQENVSCCYAVQDKTWVQGTRQRLGVLHRARRRPDDGLRHVECDRLRRRHGGRLRRHHPLLLTDAMRAEQAASGDLVDQPEIGTGELAQRPDATPRR